jgi:penicillin amidase
VRALAAAGLAPASPSLDAWVDGTPRARVAANFGRAVDLRRVLSDALAGPTLLEAWKELHSRLGEPAGWEWGKIHRALFEHPLASSPPRRAVFNVGDVPRGGDATTPNATGAGARQASGASFREVIDLSDWDRSMTTNVPGLSGQPGSPHYSDLLPLWAEGRYHPLLFSRAAIEAAAAERLVLRPSSVR